MNDPSFRGNVNLEANVDVSLNLDVEVDASTDEHAHGHEDEYGVCQRFVAGGNGLSRWAPGRRTSNGMAPPGVTDRRHGCAVRQLGPRIASALSLPTGFSR